MMSSPRIAAVLLAAGQARRFGAPKQLQDWHGQPMIRHVIMGMLAAPVMEIVVVLGAHLPGTARAIHGLPVTLAVNHAWHMGMSQSVRVGLRALRQPPDAVLFFLADQPQIPTSLPAQLIQTFIQTQKPIVAPRVGDRRGNPVLFARALFPALMQVRGDQGGRAVMAQHADDIAWVEADERVLFDVDRPEDMVARDMRGMKR